MPDDAEGVRTAMGVRKTTLSPQNLRVGTYNIYNTTARYTAGRRELLKLTIDELDTDFLGMQEVVFGSDGQTQMMLNSPGGDWAQAFEAPLVTPLVAGQADPSFRIDGNAILTRERQWKVVEDSHEILNLSDVRTAQRLRVRHVQGGVEIMLVNTHLHWAVDPLGVSQRSDAEIRAKQLEMILQWLEGHSMLPTILVGDLNAYFPDEQIRNLLNNAGFESAYAHVHGKDCKTCPTPLEAPTIVPESSVEQVCDFVLIRQASAGTLGEVRLTPTAAARAGDRAADGDPTLFPSDHYAVVVSIEVNHLEKYNGQGQPELDGG